MTLRTAAAAVLAQFDAPPSEWEKHGHPEDLMADLRAELAQPAAQPVAWLGGDGHPHHIRAVQTVTERNIYGPWVPLYAAPIAPAPSEFEETDPDNCEHYCPHCGGSGEIEEADSAGPDARMVPVSCPHCDGHGTLIAAYRGAVNLLLAEQRKYLKACADWYHLKHAAQAAQPAPSEPKVTVTTNPAGDAVAVTLTDDDHRIVRVLWERAAQPAPQPLSEAKAIALWDEYATAPHTCHPAISFVRAVLVAAGITAAPTTDTLKD